jgi:hypothetical protein
MTDRKRRGYRQRYTFKLREKRREGRKKVESGLDGCFLTRRVKKKSKSKIGDGGMEDDGTMGRWDEDRRRKVNKKKGASSNKQ